MIKKTYCSSRKQLSTTALHNLNNIWIRKSRTREHVRLIIYNNDLYQQTNKIPLTLTILKNRWKLFGQILCLHPQTPAQQPMRHISPYQNSCFRGRQRITLPITMNRDIVTASEDFNFSQRYGIQQFQSLQDLDRLIELGCPNSISLSKLTPAETEIVV